MASSRRSTYSSEQPETGTFILFQTVKTFGQLDIVVSNAAVNPQMGNTLEVRRFCCLIIVILIEKSIYYLCSCLELMTIFFTDYSDTVG